MASSHESVSSESYESERSSEENSSSSAEFESSNGSSSVSGEESLSDIDSADYSTSSTTTERGSVKRKLQIASASAAVSSLKSKHGVKKSTSLTVEQVNELSAWLFTDDEAIQVEMEVKDQLPHCRRLTARSDRTSFVDHLLSEGQRQNFKLLIVGFCRKFSTLVEECFKQNSDKYAKAAFSVRWMKFLSNFHPRKGTQERAVVEKIINDKNFSAETVHAVVSAVHECVYHVIHDHVRIKKNAQTEASSDTLRTTLATESDETLYRYGGAALQRMIKLRSETLAGKKGKRELSEQRRPQMEEELRILKELVLQDKSDIPRTLKDLDEGGLIFPRLELIPFLRSVDSEVREFATDKNFRNYPTKFLRMCQNAVLENERLECDFVQLIGSLPNCAGALEDDTIKSVFQGLVSKMANTRLNEIKCANDERELKEQGKVVDADEMLRPRLKTFALAAKRKSASTGGSK